MSVIWLESWDYFGTNTANLPLRGYALFTTLGQPSLTPSNFRTGSHCLNFLANSRGLPAISRVFDTPLNKVVVGIAMRPSGVVSFTAVQNYGFGVANALPFDFKVVINADLGITVYYNGAVVGTSAPNLITLNSYQWVEAVFTNNAHGGGPSTGACEVRVGGNVAIIITGINVTTTFTRASLGATNTNISSGSAYDCAFDDWVINTDDFLGDRRVTTSYPDADTVLADWTPSTGSTGWNLIDESNPSDADFITANVAGDISEFEKQSIAIDTNSVAAVCVIARAFKDSAGPSTFRLGVNSAGNVINSAELTPNTTVAYFSAIFDLDPNGNIPWTRAAVDASTIRLTRVV